MNNVDGSLLKTPTAFTVCIAWKRVNNYRMQQCRIIIFPFSNFNHCFYFIYVVDRYIIDVAISIEGCQKQLAKQNSFWRF